MRLHILNVVQPIRRRKQEVFSPLISVVFSRAEQSRVILLMQRAKSKNKKKDNGGATRNLIPRGNLLPRRVEPLFGRVLNFTRDISHTTTTLDVSIGSTIITAFTSGILANTTDIANPIALVPLFSTTYAGIWREYRVIGLRWKVRFTIAATVQGELWLWMDEKSSSVPTSQDANKANKCVLPISAIQQGNLGQECVGTWQADDLADLQWSPTTTAVSPVYLKQYASPGLTGTSSSTTGTFIITAMLRIQFRDQI